MPIKESTTEIQGAKIVLETLKDLGVDTVFGYPGGIVLNLYDELYNCKDIKHILVRHEQSAVHAAEGYARETGKCGVVIVTSGPGATNTVTGIANAYLDGYPLLIITGQVNSNLINKDAFQEVNICRITNSCTKKTYQVLDINNLQKTLYEAYYTANSGKKGPVVVDIPKNILAEKCENSIQYKIAPLQRYSQKPKIKRIKDRILDSHKPVILCGGGITHSDCGDELIDLVKTLDIPFVSTMMGLGAFKKDERNYFGMVGIFGDKAANEILRQSDLIISMGARFNDRISCMFNANDLENKFIKIDINEKEIFRGITPLEYVIGDCKGVISQLASDITNKQFSEWTDYAQHFRALNVQNIKISNRMHSFEILNKVEELSKNLNVTFTSEVGQHQLYTVKNLNFYKNRKILLSGGSGTMGFGFPAAIGAAIGHPEKTIICITGDGSFQMGLHELATCKDYDLNIKILIFNNGYLGMVRQLQQKFCDSRYSQTKISNPDFVKLAQSYGIEGYRVQTREEIEPILKKIFATKGTFVVEFCIEPMEVV